MTGDEKLATLTEFDDRMAALPGTVDRVAIERMRTLAHVLDDGIGVPGTDARIGIDPLLGLVPGVGDLLAGGLSLYLVVEARRQGVSATTLLKMLGNIAVDVGVGTIPILGDLFDAVWKANTRNFDLVVRDLTAESDRSMGSSGAPADIEIE